MPDNSFTGISEKEEDWRYAIQPFQVVDLSYLTGISISPLVHLLSVYCIKCEIKFTVFSPFAHIK